MSPEPTLASQGDPIGYESVIENEIPTYRAISALALTSAVLGLLSAASFLEPWMLVSAALAIVAGLVADRRIRRQPDALTGRSFAQAGIAMGLTFAVGSVAYSQITSRSLKAEARKFGAEMVERLNAAKKTEPYDTTDVIWYMIPPPARKGLTAEDARAMMAQYLKDSSKLLAIETTVREMLKNAGKDHPIEMVSVEDAFFVEMDSMGLILLKVGDAGHEDHDHAPGEAHDDHAKVEGLGNALVVVRGMGEFKKNRWYIDQIRYPYVPKTYEHVEKKAESDDGHGHGH